MFSRKNIQVGIFSALLLIGISTYAVAELQIDTVSPTRGSIGNDLEITIEGSGFDEKTQFDMWIYKGAKSQYISRLYPVYVRSVAVVNDIAYVATMSNGLQVIDLSDPSHPEVMGYVDTPGYAHGIAVSDDKAFVTSASGGLQVLDVSDPSNPIIIGAVDLPGYADDVIAVGEIAFVTGYEMGLQIVDVSNPHNPVILSSMMTPVDVTGIAVEGTTAFLTCGESGLHLVDVEDSKNPIRIGFVDTEGYASNVSVENSRAFVACGNSGFEIIDCRDPYNPIIISSTETVDYAHEVIVWDKTAFVACGKSGIQAFDIHDFSMPFVIGSVDTLGVALGVALTNNEVIVADSNRGLVVLPSLLNINQFNVNSNTSIVANLSSPPIAARYSIRAYNGLERSVLHGAIDYTLILDSVYPTVGKIGESIEVSISGNGFDNNTKISIYPDSTNQHSIIGSLEVLGAASSVEVIEKTAFVAAGDQGFHIIDVKNPSAPNVLSSIDIDTRDIAVMNGSMVLAGGRNGFFIIDTNDPVNPIVISSLGTCVYGIAIEGDKAFVVCHSILQVIDISDSYNPIILCSMGLPYRAERLHVLGNTAFVACLESGLQLIDVSVPSDPVIIGSVDTTPGWAHDVVVVSNIAYVADGIYGGLQIIDVEDTSNPVTIGSVDTPDMSTGISVSNDFAYIADQRSGVHVVDIHDPYNPVISATIETKGGARDVKVVESKAFVASGDLQIIDAPHKLNSAIIGSVVTEGDANEIEVMDNIGFVAEKENRDHPDCLTVVDMRNHDAPFIISSKIMEGGADDIAVTEDMIVLWADYSGIKLIDANILSNPVIIATVDTTDPVDDVSLINNTAFVAANDSGFQIVDISDPMNPLTVASVSIHGAESVSVWGDTAFVSSYNVLKVIDISDWLNPRIIGSVDIPWRIKSLVASNNSVFLVDTYSFQVVDVSDPTEPLVISSLETSGGSINIVENTVFITRGYSGISAIDVSDPLHPSLIGSVDTTGSTSDIAIIGNKAVVADGSNGICILPIPSQTKIFDVIDNTTINATIPCPPIPGHYTLRVFNEKDHEELIGALTFLGAEEYETLFHEKAIIVAGRNDPFDPLWDYTRKNANHAYETLLFRGYTHEAICYLSPENTDVDGDGVNDVDYNATRANLSNAFDTWLFNPSSLAHGLVVYMIGHGGTGAFQINPTERVSALEMAYWLDDAEIQMPGRLVFIYDGCFSGSFYDVLIPGIGQRRIVMTSTDEGEVATFQDDGERSFSYRFWYDVYEGFKVGYAFSRARAEMSPYGQTGRIYNDTLANTVYIGVDKVIAPIGPRISWLSFDGSLTLNGEASAPIEVAVDSPNGIKYVKAIIIPPGLSQQSPDEPVTDLPEVLLTDYDHDGTYEGVYNGFTQAGTYTITISAEDKEDLRAYDPNRIITVIQTVGLLPGDLNGDGDVNLADAVTALKAVTDDTVEGLQPGADPNQDGQIGLMDAIILLRVASGL